MKDIDSTCLLINTNKNKLFITYYTHADSFNELKN